MGVWCDLGHTFYFDVVVHRTFEPSPYLLRSRHTATTTTTTTPREAEQSRLQAPRPLHVARRVRVQTVGHELALDDLLLLVTHRPRRCRVHKEGAPQSTKLTRPGNVPVSRVPTASRSAALTATMSPRKLGVGRPCLLRPRFRRSPRGKCVHQQPTTRRVEKVLCAGRDASDSLVDAHCAARLFVPISSTNISWRSCFIGSETSPFLIRQSKCCV